MSDELVVAATTEIEKRDDLFLVARNHMELQACQTRMTAWFSEQILLCKRNERELRTALETAERNKWQATTHRKQLQDSMDRKVWLVKCLRAIEAGYAIIPDMPADVFAIRVESGTLPSPDQRESRYNRPWLPNQQSDKLPEGEGDYVSSRPRGSLSIEQREDEKKQKYNVHVNYAKAYKPVQFPVIAARTRIMEATEAALALKVFDEVAIAPQTKRPDPMILGRIYKPCSANPYDNTHLTFIICWFLDLESI